MDPAGNLDSLHDIVVPEAVSFWPLAPGLWVGVVACAMLVVLGGWLRGVAWKRQAYRRAGLAVLAEATTVYEVSVVLKRVALVSWPRETVAALSGEQWTTFLNAQREGTGFDASALNDSSAPVAADLRVCAQRWIKMHRVPVESA